MARQNCRGLLSRTEERLLISQAQSPNPHIANHAFGRLLHHFAPLIAGFASQITCNSDEREDVEQQLRIAFLRSVRNFDPKQATRLATYARRYLSGARYTIQRHQAN